MSHKEMAIDNIANDIKYNGKILAESKHFAKDMWAATVVLDPDAYYTIHEAEQLISAFLVRKVG